MLQEFREFARRGHVVDLAVGIILVAAMSASAQVDQLFRALGGSRWGRFAL